MIGVPGIAHRLFGALKASNVSVMFIAQASSEHSICFAIKQNSSAIAKNAIEEAFFYELKNGLIEGIKVINDCSIIAAVGESMGNMPGVSGIFFGALGSASINILSISQGCDERNISAVVYAKDSAKALRAVHSAFWLSSQSLGIGIVGTGRVGGAVVQMLIDQLRVLEERFGLSITIRGVANSTKMVLDEDLVPKFHAKMEAFNDHVPGSNGRGRRPSPMITQDSYKALNSLLDSSVPVDLGLFADHIKNAATPHTIIIDCSNSDAVALLHPSWLYKGSHVVTANNRALACSLELYNQVFAAARSKNRLYMSEVTIGASIPVMTTMSDLLCSGDHIHSIVGLVSASAGKMFTDICDCGFSFTKAVARTYAQGLFEEDVFRDLEGTESAQKLLILARELGIPMQLSDVKIEPIASRRYVNWANIGDAFVEEDRIFAERAAAAASRGCTLRYVHKIECTPAAFLGAKDFPIIAEASVKVDEVPLDSPLAMVKGAIYHFAFHTERYQQNPLIVQVPLPMIFYYYLLNAHSRDLSQIQSTQHLES